MGELSAETAATCRPGRLVVTRVVRVRLPGDRSFVYLCYRRKGLRCSVRVEWIPRRYYSTKRVERMTFRTHPGTHAVDCSCVNADVVIPTVGEASDG